VTRLENVVAGHGRDRPPARATRSPRQHQHRLAKDEISGVVAANLAGTPVDDIAKQFEINRTTVTNVVKRTDIEQRTRVIDRHLDEARQLYQSGQSLDAVDRGDTDGTRGALQRTAKALRSHAPSAARGAELAAEADVLEAHP
jgi:hypothetical protein